MPISAQNIGALEGGAAQQQAGLGGETDDDDDDDDDSNDSGSQDYAGVHGATLQALDAHIAATNKANSSLKEQQQVLTKQREALGNQVQLDKQATQLTGARVKVAAAQTAGALDPSAGQPQQPGVLSAPGVSPTGMAAGTKTWKDHAATFDVDKHLQDMNYTDDHWKEANAELKAQTGKTAHQMYDELEHRGLILPQDAKLSDRQKGELFLKFGMGILKQQSAGLVRPENWTAPNAMADIANAGEGVLADYKGMLGGQREAALEQWKNSQEIGKTAAGKQADLEKEQVTATAAANLKRFEEGEQNKRATDSDATRVQVGAAHDQTRKDVAAANAKGRAANEGTWARVDEPDKDGNVQEHNTKSGATRTFKGSDGQPIKSEKSTGGKAAAASDAKNQAELDKEQDSARTAAKKTLADDPIHSYYKDADGKRKQYTEDELAAQNVAKMPAHQRAASSAGTAAGKTPLILADKAGTEHNGRVYDGKGDWNDPGSWKAK